MYWLCGLSLSLDSLLPELEPPLPLILLHTHHIARSREDRGCS